MNRELAAAVAFTALGANLIGAIVLLLLNAGSRSVRWYIPFQLSLLMWLAGQGAHQLWPSTSWESVEVFGAVLLPLLFLLFALMEAPGRPSWHGIVLLVLAAPLVPFVMRGLYGSQSAALDTMAWLWFLAGWIGGPAVLWVRGKRHTHPEHARAPVRRRLVMLALLLLAPVSVVGAMFVEGPAFVLFVIPVMTILVQFLIFYGVTRMQLYDIEVRVRRSGDIAAETFETERMAVLGQVAATIAHEVRNPMTGVRSLAQRIAQDDIAPDKRRKYAEVILDETSRVEKLVSNLLELARRGTRGEERKQTTTRLATLFEDLTLLVAARAERARVHIVCDPRAASAPAPREALAQALLNLLLNAIAHSPQNSVVTLSAVEASDRVDISVRDHGPGIPLQDRDAIFQPFYTTSAKGTGLGLSVVRHLATEHDWKVRVDDAPGGGTQFTLSIQPNHMPAK